MQNLYIDFDGVILDTIKISYEMLEKENIPLEDGERVRYFYANLDWGKILKPELEINHSFINIQKLIDSNRFDVSILTHINSLQEAIEKVHFIRKYFKDITVILVPKAISKTKMVQTKGSLLVDDFIGNLEEWESEEGVAIKFCRQLNGKGFLAIDSLDKLLEMQF